MFLLYLSLNHSIAQISPLQKIVCFPFFIGIGCACVKGSRVVQDSGYYGRATGVPTLECEVCGPNQGC